MVYFPQVFYHRTVLEDSLLEPLGNCTDPAAAARAWCASPRWAESTPNLEDWRAAVSGLRQHALSRDDLAQMARTNPHRIAFPPIPFFEKRQVDDLLAVTDEWGAAALAGQLMGLDSLLTVSPADAPKICWLSIPLSTGMEYEAWCWLIPAEWPARPMPSEAGVRVLWSIEGPRGQQALKLLEQSATLRTGKGDAGARTVLATLEDLRGVPESAAVEAKPSEAGDSLASHCGALCGKLFLDSFGDSLVDLEAWKALESDMPGQPEAHPLSLMAEWLRGQEFAVERDGRAWEALAYALSGCPGLMAAGDASAVLPALELAACVRSTVSIGEVAVGLVLLAGEHRADPAWWKALWAGLREPLARRGGWALGNDRTGFAQDAVRAQEHWLSAPELKAFDAAMDPEGNS